MYVINDYDDGNGGDYGCDNDDDGVSNAKRNINVTPKVYS
jgi:hypothetical protein